MQLPGSTRVVRAGLAFWLSIVLGSAPLPAADLTFKQDTDLARILEICATLGKFNVVVSPQVRNKMNLNLSQVDPLEAVFIVANLHNLKVKRLTSSNQASSSMDTYVIGPADVVEKGFERQFTRTIRLRYARAEDAVRLLQKVLAKDVGVGLQADARTNSLMMTGSEEVLSRVGGFVGDLDLPVPEITLHFSWLEGPASAPREVWSTRLEVSSGQPTEIAVDVPDHRPGGAQSGEPTPPGTPAVREGGAPEPRPKATQPAQSQPGASSQKEKPALQETPASSSLKGTFLAAANRDGYCNVQASLHGSWNGPGGRCGVRYSGRVTLRDREERVLQEVRKGPDELAVLKLRVEVRGLGSGAGGSGAATVAPATAPCADPSAPTNPAPSPFKPGGAAPASPEFSEPRDLEGL